MTPFRKLLLVTMSAVALCGVQACSAGTELNPQPLPPADPQRGSEEGKGTGDNNGSSGSSGAIGTTPGGGTADAGTEGGDAADGGDR